MPVFLDAATVNAIHTRQIEMFGGATGIRSPELLESAVGQASMTYAYTGEIFQAAAQYCISLSGNHPFLDGNKRVAAACMLVFLRLNKLQLHLTPDQLYDWTMQVANGQLQREQLAELLREHCE
ncbi:MAG: type II toxin-antitoxin system death-on-curing family toxin [Candidatus Thiothrix singaporensis]|uniref:Type II toxin-antitoxin system death-on-curing family toxin n=1 Tax=Candidatus Thiothrix singaporensis TaxID=2799669 RepID=A0A7L6ANQ2_9GAMM|nr:MAG: type II toxin-antitoxin system death-on-curing family toxin [Candidatus Thiothrix singaporensis]